MASSPTIQINGKDYALDELTDETKRLLGSIRAVDEEISRLRRQLAIAQTARAAYARNVARNLDTGNDGSTAEQVAEVSDAQG